MIALRLIFTLPIIFIVSYLLAGVLLSVLAVVWPYLLVTFAAAFGLLLLAAKAS